MAKTFSEFKEATYDAGEAKQRLQKRRMDAMQSQQQSMQKASSDTKWNKRKEEIKNELRKEIETGT